jgi:dienelactone hydrolase
VGVADVRFADDPGFDFAIRCILNAVPYGAAEVGEVLATAGELDGPSVDAFHEAWTARGRAVRAVAEACERAGHRESAAMAHLRAANYLSAAVWYVLGTSAPERAPTAWREHRDSWEAAARTWPAPAERLTIPFEGTALDGYLFSPPGAEGRPRPLVVLMQGLDAPISDAMMTGLQDAVLRGYRTLVFDGPGQGSAIYERGLRARHDWEVVVGAALDHVLARPDIDPDRVALVGVAHSGHLGARAAAFEPRVRALVLDPGVMRVVDGTLAQLPGEVVERFRAGDREGFDAALAAAEQDSAELRFTDLKTREPWGLGTPLYDALSGLARMNLAEVAGRVTCPALVLDPDDAEGWPGQSKEVAAALGGPVRLERFTAREGASLDCEILAPQVRNQRIFDWLDETLGRA